MTTLTTASARPSSSALISIVPDASRRGRINAAVFGAIVYFGLSFAQAVVLPAPALLLGQAAALVIGTYAAGRMVGAADRRAWFRASGSVIVAVVIGMAALWALMAFVVWGPLAP